MSGAAILPVHYVALAAVLFGIGAVGALTRRNALTLLMSIELMLNAANLTFVAYAKQYGHAAGRHEWCTQWWPRSWPATDDDGRPSNAADAANA